MGTLANGLNQIPYLTRSGAQRLIISGWGFFVTPRDVLASRKVGHMSGVSVAVHTVVLLGGTDDELPSCLGQGRAFAVHVGRLDPQSPAETYLGETALRTPAIRADVEPVAFGGGLLGGIARAVLTGQL